LWRPSLFDNSRMQNADNSRMGGFLRQKVSKLVIGSAACSIAVPGSKSAACATAPVVMRTCADPLLLSRCQENQGESGPTSLTEAHLEAPHGAPRTPVAPWLAPRSQAEPAEPASRNRLDVGRQTPTPSSRLHGGPGAHTTSLFMTEAGPSSNGLSTFMSLLNYAF
jgi:hypothetical protein